MATIFTSIEGHVILQALFAVQNCGARGLPHRAFHRLIDDYSRTPVSPTSINRLLCELVNQRVIRRVRPIPTPATPASLLQIACSRAAAAQNGMSAAEWEFRCLIGVQADNMHPSWRLSSVTLVLVYPVAPLDRWAPHCVVCRVPLPNIFAVSPVGADSLRCVGCLLLAQRAFPGWAARNPDWLQRGWRPPFSIPDRPRRRRADTL